VLATTACRFGNITQPEALYACFAPGSAAAFLAWVVTHPRASVSAAR